MFCCVCAGSCNHVGPHSFCEAHGGRPAVTTTNTTLSPWLIRPDPVPLRQRWRFPRRHAKRWPPSGDAA